MAITGMSSGLGKIRPIMGSIQSVPIPVKPAPQPAPEPAPPFVTISRQPGAGAWTLARQLVDALNQSITDDQPWTCWDKELVEKVAADHHLSKRLIESLEDRGHSFLLEILESLSSEAQGGESKLYSRICATIRALAGEGRVVIVGRGGAFITSHMPGGTHIRLVAPLEKRIQYMASEYNLTPEAAAVKIREIERNRESFYHHHWPTHPLTPESFTLTINTAQMEQKAIVEMIAAMVRTSVAVTQ